MVGGADKKPQGRRGGKKARSRAGGGNKGGGNNGGRNVDGDNGGGAGAVEGGQSFPVVSDSRFSSMHSAPVSVGDGWFSRYMQQPRFVCGGTIGFAVTCGGRWSISCCFTSSSAAASQCNHSCLSWYVFYTMYRTPAYSAQSRSAATGCVLYSKAVELHRFTYQYWR